MQELLEYLGRDGSVTICWSGVEWEVCYYAPGGSDIIEGKGRTLEQAVRLCYSVAVDREI